MDERWTVARNGFDEAATKLSSAADVLDAETVDDERFDRRYQNVRTLARTLADAAAELGPSANAYRQGDTGDGDDRRRDGRSILRADDLVTDMDSVRQIENFSGP